METEFQALIAKLRHERDSIDEAIAHLTKTLGKYLSAGPRVKVPKKLKPAKKAKAAPKKKIKAKKAKTPKKAKKAPKVAGPSKAQVALRVLQEAKGPMKAADVLKKTNGTFKDLNNASVTLAILAKKGQVTRVGKGQYTVSA